MRLFSTCVQARAGMAGGPSRPDLLLMEGCWPVFLHRSLASSRALERFRNQVPSRTGCHISSSFQSIPPVEAARWRGCLTSMCTTLIEEVDRQAGVQRAPEGRRLWMLQCCSWHSSGGLSSASGRCLPSMKTGMRWPWSALAAALCTSPSLSSAQRCCTHLLHCL
jgi:hypothetical protein